MNNTEVFRKRLIKLIDSTGMSDRKFVDEFNKKRSDGVTIYPSQISDIRNGKRMPRLDVVIALAECFNVSLDYLTGLSNGNTKEVESKEIEKRTGLNADAAEKLIFLQRTSEAADIDILLSFLIEDCYENYSSWLEKGAEGLAADAPPYKPDSLLHLLHGLLDDGIDFESDEFCFWSRLNNDFVLEPVSDYHGNIHRVPPKQIFNLAVQQLGERIEQNRRRFVEYEQENLADSQNKQEGK